MANEGRVPVSARLPEHLHARLVAAAQERDVSVNFLLTRAVERYLVNLKPVEA